MLTEQEFRKANECIAAAERERPKAQLFDEFWREGELALLFGASGTGKSLLGVQIADALARGTPMHGFVMPNGRRKVLYVDLSFSDSQFRERYGRHRFPQNLYRGRPRREADLLEWLQAAVEANDFRVVIVDDLTAVKRTHDGIRETLALMRGLKRLCGELCISILVLSDALVPKDGWASEDDLMRSRVLCSVADSVFCIGKMRRSEDGRRIFQTRSRAAKLVWTSSNCPECEIKHLESGLLGFEFDERFSPDIDDETRRRLGLIKVLRDRGETFRSIAVTLALSKSSVHSFWKKWSPMAERLDLEEPETTKVHEETRSKTREPDEWQPPKEKYQGEFTDDYLVSIGGRRIWQEKWEAEQRKIEEECTVQNAQCEIEEECTMQNAQCTIENQEIVHPALCTVHLEDLEIEYNAYHKPIYVESRDEYTRKPLVWYQQFPEGTRRFQRGPFSIQVQHLNTGPFL